MVTTPIATTDAAHGHCCSVNAVARCTGYVCSGGGDAAIRVWKARTLEPVRLATCSCAQLPGINCATVSNVLVAMYPGLTPPLSCAVCCGAIAALC